MSSSAELYREFQRSGGVADLSDRVKLLLTGPDRIRYLNGQVTSNVTRLADNEGQPGCVVTPKGKLCAEVWIAALPEGLLIDSDASLRETLPVRLGRYIIADDVLLEDVTAQRKLLHCIGALPAGTFSENRTRADRFGREGWDVLITPEQFDATLHALAATRPVLDGDMLETIRVERGIPRWGRELDENTLPPEAGLDRTHVDYHKGCYVGQEVISRLKSVGHVKRRLVGFMAAEADCPLTAGMQLFASARPDKPVGQLTSVARSFALERQVALGYLRCDAPMRDLVARRIDASNAEVSVIAQELPFVP